MSGAPKAYPNAFIAMDTFVDTIKTEGHKKLKVYFDPEFIKVVDAKKNDIQLLKTNVDQSAYYLQILNLDLQKQHILTINLEDRTTQS